MERDHSCPATPCIEHQGYVAKDGYGRVSRRQLAHGPLTAHRAAWIEAHGPIPRHLDVMHLCHNRICVNVEHLRPGTRSENLKMSGRNLAHPHYGSDNGASKLTESDRWIIRRLYHHHGFTQTELAPLFGISQQTISRQVAS